MQVSLHIISITTARKHRTRKQGIFVDLQRLRVCHTAPKGYREFIHRGVVEAKKLIEKCAQVESVKARRTDMMMQLTVVESKAQSPVPRLCYQRRA